MKKLFILFATFYCCIAMAVNPNSEIGRSFTESAMPECVDGLLEEGIGLGIASDYCKCILDKTLNELSVEQITEYYQYGREIEDLMEQSAKQCINVLLNSQSKEDLISVVTQQCVHGATQTGASLGIASEYCKCISNKMFEKLTIEQITEYYNNGRDIEDLAKECMQLLAK